MPQMVTDLHLEASLTDLLPSFIENLGSQKVSSFFFNLLSLGGC
jgi:hypothetical protein